MRSLALKLVLMLIVGMLLTGGVLALTLDQGIYKLQWQTTNPMQDPSSYASGFINAMKEEAAKSYQGLYSTKCYSGEVGQYRVILDESQGTGKGYDIAYLLPRKSKETDLSKAAKLSLKGEDGNLRSENGTIDIQVGEGQSCLTKEASISFSAYGATNGADNPEDIMVNISLGGCWSGTIPSDAGPLEVALCDLNSNGVYGDFMSCGKGSFPQPGDGVQIRRKKAVQDREWEPIYLSKVVSYGSKLYTMKASKIGDTLEIRPYKGETGRLTFKAIVGNSKSVNCTMAYVYGDNGLYRVQTAHAMTLPPGAYKCPYAIIGNPDKVKNPFALTLQSDKPVKVVKDRESVVRLGGPIKVAFESGSSVMVARAGDTKHIGLVFTAGKDKVRGVAGNRPAVVNVRDSKGKLLASMPAGFG